MGTAAQPSREVCSIPRVPIVPCTLHHARRYGKQLSLLLWFVRLSGKASRTSCSGGNRSESDETDTELSKAPQIEVRDAEIQSNLSVVAEQTRLVCQGAERT